MRKFNVIAVAVVASLVVVIAGTVAVSRLSDGDGGAEARPGRTDGETSGALVSDRDEPALQGAPPGQSPYGDDGAAVNGGEQPAAGDVAEGPGGLPLPQTVGRKIVRTASLTLAVEDVGASVQKVESIATAAGGFVSESSVFVEPEPPAPSEDGTERRKTETASVTVRVPAETYASVMKQLRGIAEEVEGESSQGSDVTEEFTDLESRVRNLEATERQYLELLKVAKAIPDILTVQDRLNQVRLEIEQAQGRMQLLNDLTDLATITAQLRPFVLGAEEPGEPGWAQAAWEDARETSEDMLKALGQVGIVAGVVLAWLSVPALAIVIAWRLLGGGRARGAGAGPSAS